MEFEGRHADWIPRGDLSRPGCGQMNDHDAHRPVGCGHPRWAVADTRSIYDDLAGIYLWIAGAVFAVIVAVTVVFLVRYRAGRSPRPSGRSEAPRLERSYVALLAVVLVGLMVLTFRAQLDVQDITQAAAKYPRTLHVEVVGAQWQWRFRYPGSPTVEQTAPEGTPPKLMVPVGRRVLFRGRSQDVLHSFWIPDLKFQRQVWPDHVETWALVFPHPGTYVGVCAWFCGLYHQNMHFEAAALPAAQFDAWLAAPAIGVRDMSVAAAPAPAPPRDRRSCRRSPVLDRPQSRSPPDVDRGPRLLRWPAV